MTSEPPVGAPAPLGRHAAPPAALAPDAVTALADALTGRVVTPHDDDWAAARTPWNVIVDQQPLAVVLAADADDVVATVRFAARHGLTVSAQPSGHGASEASTGTVLLRTRALTDIWVDPAAKVARVGAGVTWGALQDALAGTGLTGLAGSNPDVTVVGYCLGGGLSWFSRAFGRGAGAVRAVELVDASGAHRWVTDATEPELMWALRGGGGDLAVVTAVEIDLFDAPSIYGGLLAFPGDAARPVLRAFAEATRAAPEELTLWAMLMHFPDVDLLPPELRGQSFTLVGATFLGAADDAERHLAPIRAAAPVLRDALRVVGPEGVGALAEEPVDPTPAAMAATYLHTLDDAAIDAVLAQAGVGTGTPLASVQLRHLGGALGRSTRPAVAGARTEPYLLSGLALVMAPEMVPPVWAALDRLMGGVAPWSAEAAPLTFLDRDEPLSRAYVGPDLDRLRALKAELDPAGVIRGNRPIPRV